MHTHNSETAKPKLVTPLSNVALVVGESVELECAFRLGDPKATVVW